VTGQPPPAHKPRFRFLTALAIAAVATLLLFYLPLPKVLIFGPGGAVDLNALIDVPGHSPPPGTLYLTDVTVMPGRPAFYIVGKLVPGFEVVPRADYAGTANDTQFDRELVDAMQESQTVAQVVAERAAGLPVKTQTDTTVVGINKALPAAHCFKNGDVIESIDGRAPRSIDAVAALAASKPAGSAFSLSVKRGSQRVAFTCPTAMYQGKPRFGVIISQTTRPVSLPVRVTYHVKDINGSSAGLMFALQIYRTLTGQALAGGRKIAGTGVLSPDGTVLPVGGAIEKLHAAMGKGADIFIVPKSDYKAVMNTQGIRIVSVGSFDDALRQLAHL
jgi:PDZ domain-containing protein